MAFESVNYQCPACGGPLHFASAEQKLVCDYCDSRFEVEEVEALYRERQDKADAKADAAAAAPKPAVDDAVQELISYFSKVDEPTAIVFFGDHQPNLPEDFYNTLLESQRGDLSDAELRQKKMVTPFFIWANYDIKEQTNMQISANYLSAYALNALGCSTSGFDQMRLALQQQIPVMNVNGYHLPDGTWYPQGEQPENDLLNDYHHAEYAQIFDAKNRSDEWYTP